MKIAYINEFPELKSFEAFMQEYRMEEKQSGLSDLAQKTGERIHYISAYDRNRLVAIGFASVEGSAPEAETAQIYVLPAYAQRGIEINVYKLLAAEWKFSPVPAIS
jgi:hypothetical protein